MKTSDDKENKPKFKWSRNSKLKPPNKLTFTNSKSRKSKPNSEMHKNKTKNFTADLMTLEVKPTEKSPITKNKSNEPHLKFKD